MEKVNYLGEFKRLVDALEEGGEPLEIYRQFIPLHIRIMMMAPDERKLLPVRELEEQRQMIMRGIGFQF